MLSHFAYNNMIHSVIRFSFCCSQRESYKRRQLYNHDDYTAGTFNSNQGGNFFLRVEDVKRRRQYRKYKYIQNDSSDYKCLWIFVFRFTVKYGTSNKRIVFKTLVNGIYKMFYVTMWLPLVTARTTTDCLAHLSSINDII